MIWDRDVIAVIIRRYCCNKANGNSDWINARALGWINSSEEIVGVEIWNKNK